MSRNAVARTSALVALVPCALLVATAGAAGDEIYRWVDAEGRVIYGSEPPPDAARSEKWTPSREGSVNIVPDAARPESLRPPPSVAVPPPSAYGRARNGVPEMIGGKTEAQWRATAARLQKKIESRQSRIESIEDELSFPSRYRSSLAAAQHEARQRRKIQALAGEIVAIEDELDALRRAARKLGVPPGWLR